MRMTKFTHACVRLDDGDRSLVLDPGEFSECAEALDGASAVLITHEHFDHLNVEALLSAARGNPDLRVWAPSSVVDASSPPKSVESSVLPPHPVPSPAAASHPAIPTAASSLERRVIVVSPAIGKGRAPALRNARQSPLRVCLRM